MSAFSESAVKDGQPGRTMAAKSEVGSGTRACGSRGGHLPKWVFTVHLIKRLARHEFVPVCDLMSKTCHAQDVRIHDVIINTTGYRYGIPRSSHFDR